MPYSRNNFIPVINSVPGRRNSTIQGINLSQIFSLNSAIPSSRNRIYYGDKVIPGIRHIYPWNRVTPFRNRPQQGDKFITPREVVINRYSRDKSAKTRWPTCCCLVVLLMQDEPDRGVLGFLRAAACKNRELHFSDHLVEFLILRLKIPLD